MIRIQVRERAKDTCEYYQLHQNDSPVGRAARRNLSSEDSSSQSASASQQKKLSEADIITANEEELMAPISIPAHFDGERILLDEPIELERDARLVVTVLPRDNERDSWLGISASRLQEAYDGASDEYALDSIKELNPQYAGR